MASAGRTRCASTARNRLACKTLIKDLNIKEARDHRSHQGLPLEKDLVVDMEPFFDAYRDVMPFLIPGATSRPASGCSPPRTERSSTTPRSASCAPAAASCPVFWSDGQYFGPAAIVRAHRFIFDSRDAGTDLRLDILNSKEGVWRCRTTFNCTEACPRGIEVTKAIAEVKRALMFPPGLGTACWTCSLRCRWVRAARKPRSGQLYRRPAVEACDDQPGSSPPLAPIRYDPTGNAASARPPRRARSPAVTREARAPEAGRCRRTCSRPDRRR